MTDKSNGTNSPKDGRFRPGSSGNPRGRPKGTRNLKTDLARLMEKRLLIHENGEGRYVSGQELLLLMLFEKAAKGDIKASTQLMGMVTKLNPPDPLQNDPPMVTNDDRAILANFLQRNGLGRIGPSNDDEVQS